MSESATAVGGDQLDILTDIDRNGSLLDATLLTLVPVLLTVVFVLAPDGSQLAFRVENPSLQSAVLTHYFHASGSHFLGNVVAYLLLVPTLYVLAVLSGWRRPFMGLFAVISLVFPAVLSALYLGLIPTGEILGYSALALAFLGMEPIVLVRYLRVQYDVTISAWRSLGLFIIGAGLVVGPAIVGAARNTQLLTAGLVVVGAGYAMWLIRDAMSGGPETTTRRGYGELAIVAAVVFFTVAVLSIPNGGPTTGVGLIHLLGYLLGFGSAVVGVTLS